MGLVVAVPRTGTCKPPELQTAGELFSIFVGCALVGYG